MDPKIQTHTHRYKDYVTLTKPKVILLMLLTAMIGMLLAPHEGSFPVKRSLLALLGIALSAASAAVINHLIDRRLDLNMQRTEQRPIAQGRIDPLKAIWFSGILGILGLSMLAKYVNPITTWLTFLSQMGYAVIYSGFLKHKTHQNIVIGGLAGATPPLLGQTAMSGSIEAIGLMLAIIIFTWTPPHFWALAIHRYEDYKRANVPMLPITHGILCTKWCILGYTILLVITTLLPYLTGTCGIIYLLAAIGLGAGYLYYGFKLIFWPEPKTAINSFIFSIFYLMGLFLALLSDYFLVTL